MRPTLLGPLKTPAPYDLDKHVARVLAQGTKKPKPGRRPEQLSLFGPTYEIVPETRLYETQAGLVAVEEEMAFARAVSLHSAEKAYYAQRYAAIVGRAMQSWYRVWIELFAARPRPSRSRRPGLRTL